MSETKQATGPKFRENGTCVREWINGKLHLHAYHGESLVIDPMMFSQTQRQNFLQHGVESKYGDLFALETKDFPERAAKSREGLRRARERREWDYSGTDSWEMARAKRETGPSEDDLIEIINRVFAGKGQEMLTKALKKNEGDLQKTKEQIMQVREFASAWVEVQTARRQASLGRLETMAEDFLAGLEG